LFLIGSLAYSQTCPPASQIIVNRNGRNIVIPPSGWLLITDERKSDENNLIFLIAAWGDHVHSAGYVRCHYYGTPGQPYPHVQLETEKAVDESNISWNDRTSEHYQLCSSHSNDVNMCPFN